MTVINMLYMLAGAFSAFVLIALVRWCVNEWHDRNHKPWMCKCDNCGQLFMSKKYSEVCKGCE